MVKQPKLLYLTNGKNKILVQRLKKLGFVVESFDGVRALTMRSKQIQAAICFMDLELPNPILGFNYLQNLVALFQKTLPIYVVNKSFSPEVSAQITSLGGAGSVVGMAELTALKKVLIKHVETEEMQSIQDDTDKAKTSAPTVTVKPGAETQKAKLLDSLEFDHYTTPDILKKFYEDFAPLFTAFAACYTDEKDSENKVRFYAHFLKPHEDEFVKYVHRLNPSEEEASLETGIRFLGITGTRNLCYTIRLAEAFSAGSKGGGFKWDGLTGKPTQLAKAALKYAFKTESYLGEDSRYAQVGFLSGLVFDVLAEYAKGQKENKRVYETMIEFFHEQALESLKFTKEIARNEKSLALEQYLIPTNLLRNVGKVILGFYFPAYLNSLPMFQKRVIPASFQIEFERTQFGMTSNFLSALACLMSSGLSPAYTAILYEYCPKFLSDVNADLFQLARVSQSTLKAHEAPKLEKLLNSKKQIFTT